MSLKVVTNSKEFRNKMIKHINIKLDDDRASRNLEKGIYNYSILEADKRKIVKKWDNKFFVQIYTSHFKSILTNLNDNWIGKIKRGDIKSHKLAFMTHQEFNHDKWGSLIDLKSKRDANKFEVNMSAGTNTFICRKCKGNQCTYYLQQTKSSDEATTIFVQCLTCGNRWKTS